MSYLLIGLVLFASDIKTETSSSITFGGPQTIQPLDGTLKSIVSPVTITLRVGNKIYDLAGALDYFSQTASHEEVTRWLNGTLDDPKFDVANVCIEQALTVQYTPRNSQNTRTMVMNFSLTAPASILGSLKEVLKTGIEKAKADARRLLSKQSAPKKEKKK